MKLRVMQILLFLPCCILDGLFLGAIELPLWIVCGINLGDKESSLEWLIELKKENASYLMI
jgi:hypothetical protein